MPYYDPTRDVAEIARQLPGLVASVRVTTANRLGLRTKKYHFSASLTD